jgi:putative hydrolase of the HAD superfamily
MAIKNIILDFGGVLLDLDYMRTQNAFVNLGCKKFESIYSQAQQTDLFNLFDKGEISEADFFNELKILGGLENTDTQKVKDAWDAMLVGFPQENYLMLKELKKKYRIFLLSNTNETHITAFEKLIENICPVNEFENLFEKVYYSCWIHKRKPDAACFLHVLKDANLSLEETIFIDDSIQHIEGAKKVGIIAHFLEKNIRTSFLLKNLKL